MAQEAAYIVITGPGHNGTRLSLREGITSFGRLPSNDVILLGDLVSRHHARILYFDGRASIQDLGSHNGSWVNGEQISTRPLSPGDMVRVGNFKVTFRVGRIEEESGPFVDEATADAQAILPELALGEPGSRPAGEARIVRSDSGSLTEPPPPLEAPEALPDHIKSREAGHSPLVQEISEAEEASNFGTLHLLYKITEVVSRAQDARDFTEKVLEFILDRLHAQSAVYFRVSSSRREPVQTAFINADGSDDLPPVSMTVVRWTVSKNFTVFSQDARNDVRFKNGQSVTMLKEDTGSIVCAPIFTGERVLGALYLARPLTNPFSENEVDAIEAICHLIAVGLDRIEYRTRAIEEAKARETLARFHSPDVVERILTEARANETVLERRTATVLFCDIRGFTKFAESAEIDAVSEFLDTYVEDLSSIVFAHRGTINKLLGDGIVAVFGAPFSYGNDAARAVSAAIEIRTALDELIDGNPELSKLHIRIGIHTGPVLTGTIGSRRRMDYTVIGETVNAAARIQAAAAARAILISEDTRALVESTVTTRPAPDRQIRGRAGPLELFEVLGPAADALETETG